MLTETEKELLNWDYDYRDRAIAWAVIQRTTENVPDEALIRANEILDFCGK